MIKKVLFVILVFLYFGCTNNTDLGNCFPKSQISIVKNLSLPELNNARVPGGFVIFPNEGIKGILLLNTSSDFVAYDLFCPNNFCESPMTFDGNFTLTCSCDGSKYSVGLALGGTPQTSDFDCPAIEYSVFRNGNLIRIN